MSSRFTDAVDPCRHSIPRSHTADTALLNAIQQSHDVSWTGLGWTGLGLGLLWLDSSAALTAGASCANAMSAEHKPLWSRRDRQ